MDASVKEEGLTVIPFKNASYSLSAEDGSLAGLVAVHVDDLIWTGGEQIENVMKKICDMYKFGKLEKDNFRYCGRDTRHDQHGIHVDCDSLIDCVKPIFLDVKEKKKSSEKVGDRLKGQLRSIIGSLAWLARVCRPDLSYPVCKLQSCVHSATYEDVKYTNNVVRIAQQTKGHGITYPRGDCDCRRTRCISCCSL